MMCMASGGMVVAASALSAGACHRAQTSKIFIDTALVSRQPMVVTVAATGTIEPAEVVLVKSKASGLIVKLPVRMGTEVKAGDLIAQIDPRNAQSAYNQAIASVNAAKTNLAVTRTQRERADTLFAQRALTAPEHEQAVVAYANAQSQLASANNDLEIAQIQLADVTIRAPQAGTIIDKEVSEGQVIASATNTVSGGTTLVTLANLQNIVDSALVTESDIGKVHVGEPASVTVDAYPNRVFHGVVSNVSPQAVTVQSVTMFPVIVELDNRANLLKPGMNSDLSLLVAQRENALVVPNDALATPTDIALAVTALGVDANAARQTTSAVSRRGAPRRGGANGVDSANGLVTGEPDSETVMDSETVTDGPVSAEPHPGIVLVLENGRWAPRRVMLGIGNYDGTEVLSGLAEGDRVALISELRVQAQRDSSLARIQNRGGLPGIGGSGRSGSGSGRGGARGGRRS
jgi:HlyD family secretion protein